MLILNIEFIGNEFVVEVEILENEQLTIKGEVKDSRVKFFNHVKGFDATKLKGEIYDIFLANKTENIKIKAPQIRDKEEKNNFMIWDNSDNGKGNYFLYLDVVNQLNQKLKTLDTKITMSNAEKYRDEFETVDEFINRKKIQVKNLKQKLFSEQISTLKKAFNKTFGKQEIIINRYNIENESFRIYLSQEKLNFKISFMIFVPRNKAKSFKENIENTGFNLYFNENMSLQTIKYKEEQFKITDISISEPYKNNKFLIDIFVVIINQICNSKLIRRGSDYDYTDWQGDKVFDHNFNSKSINPCFQLMPNTVFSKVKLLTKKKDEDNIFFVQTNLMLDKSKKTYFSIKHPDNTVTKIVHKTYRDPWKDTSHNETTSCKVNDTLVEIHYKYRLDKQSEDKNFFVENILNIDN